MTQQREPAQAGCLALENVINARDLGGLAGAGGRRVRSGRLFRSGNPALATPSDLAQLQALGLEVVIDFRSTGEKSDAESGFGHHFRWVATPVLDGSMSMDVLMPRLRDSTPADVHDFMLKVYQDFPTRYRDAFGGMMRTAQSGGPMMFHCTAGKDRTGFAALLLLCALGVAQDDILANYLASNTHNTRFNEAALARAAPLGVAPEVMRPLLEVRGDYLDASVSAIEASHGSVERYLDEALGVDVARLRDHYLEAA